MTKAAIEGLINTLLASGQPITSQNQHKSSMQKVVDELYDAVSRSKVLYTLDEVLANAAGDKILIFRGGEGKLIDASLVNPGGLASGQGITINGVNIDIGGPITQNVDTSIDENIIVNYKTLLDGFVMMQLGNVANTPYVALICGNPDGTEQAYMTFDGLGIGAGPRVVFSDTRTIARGIEYDSNYAPTFGLRSLVDKDFVTNAINDAAFAGGAAVSSTGTSILFDKSRIYGDVTAETGNVSIDPTDFVKGMTQLLIHNDATPPTFGTEFKLQSGGYVPSVDNHIMMLAVSTSKVLYSITQDI